MIYKSKQSKKRTMKRKLTPNTHVKNQSSSKILTVETRKQREYTLSNYEKERQRLHQMFFGH